MNLPEVKKNEIYTMEITGMTHEGQGVGRINDFTVFVDEAVKGEVVKVKIIKVNKSYSIGKLMEIVEVSSDRCEPFCTSYKFCGGCNLQHIDYSAQLKFKTDTVKENLKRIGKLEDIVVHDTIGMETPLYYRNKAQYPVGMTGEKLAIGFYSRRSHEIIDSATCNIQDKVSNHIRSLVREFIEENKITVYDENSGNGLVRHVVTRTGFKTGEVMVVIVINGKELPHKQKLIEVLTNKKLGSSDDSGIKEGPEYRIQSVILNINTQNTNIIFGNKNIKIYGKDTIIDYIGKFKFNISPLSFYQVNPLQTEVLYGKALEFASLSGKEIVFDIYCGIGTISLFLSEKALKVYGVEVVEEAITDARKNAEINNINNVEFIVGEAEKVIPQLYEQGIKADVVVVDPPRKGCDEVLLQTLVNMQPKRIVYVSCNPSTLARDLNYLASNGFKVIEVQPVDMFPWTSHVETVTVLYREV